MTTRREVLRLFGSASAAAWFAAMQTGVNFSIAPNAYPAAAAKDDDSTPPLAPGAPMSPERIALIEAFKKQSEGLEKKFEARTHKSDWVMPYRLFRPDAAGKMPLLVYLHGSGRSAVPGRSRENSSGSGEAARRVFPATSWYRRPTGDGL